MTDTAAALQAPRQTTDALNMMELPRRVSAAEIDDFTITADLANGRVWLVEGEAIARFAAMTNWDYYEATLRFQKVLDSAGEQSRCRLDNFSASSTLAQFPYEKARQLRPASILETPKA